MHSHHTHAQRLVTDRQDAYRRQAGLSRLNRAAKRSEEAHHIHRPPPSR